ncbi:MAG: hypothetical protein KY410_03355 [Proteobacteria bacterium]|nr:hypothetical protein [Pseudomonadota bacterium]
MLWIALALFLAAALGGLVMAVKIFGDTRPPMALALVHGAAAAAGLLLVAKVWIDSPANPLVLVGLGILVVAAIGGFFLFSFHLRDKPHPKMVIPLHALLALAGVGTLLFAAL